LCCCILWVSLGYVTTTPKTFQHNLQGWVFSFQPRARNERVRMRGDVRRWWTISIFPAGAAALFNRFLSARVQHTHVSVFIYPCASSTFLGILQEEAANSGERGVATTKHRRSGWENCIGRTSSNLLNLCSETCRGPTCAFSQPTEQQLGFHLFLREDIYRSIRKKESVMMIRLQLRSRKKMFTRKKYGDI